MASFKLMQHFLLIACAFVLGSNSIYAQQFSRIESLLGFDLRENSKGVSVADYDGDHDLDLFIVVQQPYDSLDEKTWSRLYRNDSGAGFIDVSAAANLTRGITSFGNKIGTSWGDYNNDGLPDLLLTYDWGIQLYENNGDGTFTDISASTNINVLKPCYVKSGLWWDFDNDGLLDIFLSGHEKCSPYRAFKNLGDGSFENVSESLGLNSSAFSYMSIPFDFNSDGWMDLYSAVDIGENQLFINDSGSFFTDMASSFKLNSGGNDMGLTLGDYNNDGFFDIYCTDIAVNSLFTGLSDSTFSDDASFYGIRDTDWAWDTRFADFDNDSDEDLFVVNGYAGAAFQNVLFKNLFAEEGDGFIDISEGSQVGIEFFSECFEEFDYDNDGDLDIIVSSGLGHSSPIFYNNQLIEETPPSDHNWIKVSLSGVKSNRNGFGAIIKIRYDGKQQHRFYHGAGMYSQSIQPVHFGIDTVSRIDSLLVLWPSGEIDTISGLKANTLFEISEKSGYEIIDVFNNKIYGCTDKNSCSYNPDATIDDGISCTYLPGGQISGGSLAAKLSTQNYSYQGTGGDAFVWTVEGGTILEGQGTSEVKIQWGMANEGVISVYETGECYGEVVSKKISLSYDFDSGKHSIARIWNEALLEAIRNDYARPTVHARNLFHIAVAMYDAWAIYHEHAKPYLLGNTVGNFVNNFGGFETTEKLDEALNKTISYAAYRLLTHRFSLSPGAEESLEGFDKIMEELGYNKEISSAVYTEGDPIALGNYIAQTLINFGFHDGSREFTGYDNAIYKPVNPPLEPAFAGNLSIIDPNRWQPLKLESFIDQSGHLIDGSTPEFLSPEWGSVVPFSLKEENASIINSYKLYHDPGPPPYIGGEEDGRDYRWCFSLVSVWGSHLNPFDSVIWDISPASIGNVDIGSFPAVYSEYPSFYKLFDGGDIGKGRDLNPVTNEPYEIIEVPRGDYTRVLAEFWADGPDSETPPGHWFTLLNYVSDHDLLVKKFEGEGEVLSPLEWDIKTYFIMAGAMHDAAITAWGIKGAYDYIRPISSIRYMAEMGQSSDSTLENYHDLGIPLIEGYIEVVKEEDELAGEHNENLGKIKLYTWRGHEYIDDPEVDQAGVGWILADNWWPYQRPSFVTPPFAGYISGHSTYSRAAAEVMTQITGDPYFPGGYGEFIAPKNKFLVFEEGPSVDVKLRWATYRDASDQCSLSRIWGGIHPPADDIPGRIIGEEIGKSVVEFAKPYFTGNSGLGLSEKGYSQGKIYPNPLKQGEHLTITNTLGNQEFQLVDLKGRALPVRKSSFSDGNNTTVLILAVDAPGIYILRSEGAAWKIKVE